MACLRGASTKKMTALERVRRGLCIEPSLDVCAFPVVENTNSEIYSEIYPKVYVMMHVIY